MWWPWISEMALGERKREVGEWGKEMDKEKGQPRAMDDALISAGE